MLDAAPKFKGLRIYPRGFIGADLGVLPKSILLGHEQRVRQHTFHPNMFQPEKPDVEVNRNVEEIWSFYMRNKGALANFEFREKLLKTALTAFGTKDFMTWTRLQYEGPVSGELHTKFLDDMLNYILTGRRSLAVDAWSTMLVVRDIHNNVTPVPHRHFTHDFFVDPNNPNRARNADLETVLILWTSHEGGFDDLIQTLHLLFGDLST